MIRRLLSVYGVLLKVTPDPSKTSTTAVAGSLRRLGPPLLVAASSARGDQTSKTDPTPALALMDVRLITDHQRSEMKLGFPVVLLVDIGTGVAGAPPSS
ncbi:hypothetical protein Taro_012716 [Colocasia esculenta]|uniref:Uncharacterized protein n=1 Tax=Colocasia esculenta TaxID=4460 RepID=A0A843U9K1_COLES|nr:hypothetical protein [Colocasia esculenta]